MLGGGKLPIRINNYITGFLFLFDKSLRMKISQALSKSIYERYV